MKNKKCTKCKLNKQITEFVKDKTRIDGLFPQCRECKNKDKRENYKKNKNKIYEQNKVWVNNNPEKVREIKKRYRDKNKEVLNERSRERYRNNPDKYKEIKRKSYYKNHDSVLKYQENYRKENAEKIKDRQKNYYRKNKEDVLRYHKEFRKKYPERHKEHVRRWNEKNPEKRKIYTMNRIARLKHSEGSFTSEEWEKLKDNCNYSCLCCGKKEPEIKLSIDHVIPISKGGGNNISNIQPLCLPCNQTKGVKTTDYRKEMISCLKEKQMNK